MLILEVIMAPSETVANNFGPQGLNADNYSWLSTRAVGT